MIMGIVGCEEAYPEKLKLLSELASISDGITRQYVIKKHYQLQYIKCNKLYYYNYI